MNGRAILGRLTNCSCVMDIEKKKNPQQQHFLKMEIPQFLMPMLPNFCGKTKFL